MADTGIGKRIVVFLIDGSPNGLVQCKFDLGIIGYRIPRKGIEKNKDREHLKQAGIYFLFGKTDDEAKGAIYIGQAIKRQNGEGILYRLQEHTKDKDKEFWTEAIAFTTTDENADIDLNYLEHMFYKLVENANRYEIKNRNTPNPGVVSEDKKSTLDKIIEDVKIATGLLGHNVFISEPTKSVSSDEQLYYIGQSSEKETVGNYTNEGFWVLKDSYICGISDSLTSGYKKLREKHSDLINNNKLSENIMFNSASAASSFVLGRNSNGRIDWKTKEGKTFGEIENELEK